jgi:hypothetical protein
MPINHRPGTGARASLFLVRDQISYYNALKVPNHIRALLFTGQ